MATGTTATTEGPQTGGRPGAGVAVAVATTLVAGTLRPPLRCPRGSSRRSSSRRPAGWRIRSRAQRLRPTAAAAAGPRVLPRRSGSRVEEAEETLGGLTGTRGGTGTPGTRGSRAASGPARSTSGGRMPDGRGGRTGTVGAAAALRRRKTPRPTSSSSPRSRSSGRSRPWRPAKLWTSLNSSRTGPEAETAVPARRRRVPRGFRSYPHPRRSSRGRTSRATRTSPPWPA